MTAKHNQSKATASTYVSKIINKLERTPSMACAEPEVGWGTGGPDPTPPSEKSQT